MGRWPLGSMGKVPAPHNSVVESFFGSMQIELLDRRTWTSRAELATAIFEYIRAFYNPIRRHYAPPGQAVIGARSSVAWKRCRTASRTSRVLIASVAGTGWGALPSAAAANWA
jgi:putative transposase